MRAETDQELVIVVADAGEPAKATRQVLESWSRRGLLKRLLWVEAGSAESPGHANGDVEALLLDGGFRYVSLIEQVARLTSSTVRLVCLCLVPNGSEAGTEASVTVRRIETELATRLAPSQELFTVNLVVPSRETEALTGDKLIGRFDINVVVAPEDRVSDRQADRGVSSREEYAPHAAAACATVAGLWQGMTAAPFDGRHLPQSGPRPVLVVRCFGRVLHGPDLVSDVLDRALDARRRRAGLVEGTSDLETTADTVIRKAADAFVDGVDGGVLRYRPPAPPLEEPQLPPAGLGRVLALAARLLVTPSEALLGAPERGQDPHDDRLARRARILSGGEAERVGLTSLDAGEAAGPGDHGEQVSPPPVDVAAHVLEGARTLLGYLDIAVRPVEAPSVWKSFRAVSFGMSDGGDLPVELDPADSVERLVVESKRIAPTPTASPEPPLVLHPASGGGSPSTVGLPLHACDPFQARHLKDWLDRALKGAGDDTAATQATQRVQARLEQWVAQRDRSFAWIVAARVADEFGRAAGALGTALTTVGEQLPRRSDLTERQRARRSLRTWRGALWAAALLIVTAAAGVLLAGEGLRPALVVSAVGLTAWTSGAVRAGIAVHGLLARLGHLDREATSRQLRAVRAVEHNAHEVIRLGSLYVQLRDWAAVVGLLACVADERPTHGEVRDNSPISPPDSLAIRVGAGRGTPVSSARLEADGVRILFERGWLSRLYESCLAEAVASMQQTATPGTASVVLDPDIDARGTTRRGLARLLEEGLGRRVWARTARARLSDELAGQPVAALFPLVRALDLTQVVGEPETTAPPPQEFATGAFLGEILPATTGGTESSSFTPSLWTPTARASGAPQVRETILWGIILPVPTGDGLRVHRLPSQITEGAYVSVTLRLDVAGEIGHEQLTLFTRRDRAMQPPDAWGDEDDLA